MNRMMEMEEMAKSACMCCNEIGHCKWHTKNEKMITCCHGLKIMAIRLPDSSLSIIWKLI